MPRTKQKEINRTKNDSVLTKSRTPRKQAPDAIKRKRRRRPRTVARREIKKYRTDKKFAEKHLIPKARIERLVRKITTQYHTNIRYKRDAVEVIHRAAEDYLTELFTKASRTAWHSKREMTMLKDLDLVRWLSGDIPYYPVYRPSGKKRAAVNLTSAVAVPAAETGDDTADEDEVY
jgi:histone H3/H4